MSTTQPPTSDELLEALGLPNDPAETDGVACKAHIDSVKSLSDDDLAEMQQLIQDRRLVIIESEYRGATTRITLDPNAGDDGEMGVTKTYSTLN